MTHLLIAAYDAAGNYGKDSVNIYINNSGDTIVPVVELFEPLNNDTISDYVVFRAKVTDNIGIESVDFSLASEQNSGPLQGVILATVLHVHCNTINLGLIEAPIAPNFLLLCAA